MIQQTVCLERNITEPGPLFAKKGELRQTLQTASVLYRFLLYVQHLPFARTENRYLDLLTTRNRSSETLTAASLNHGSQVGALCLFL